MIGLSVELFFFCFKSNNIFQISLWKGYTKLFAIKHVGNSIYSVFRHVALLFFKLKFVCALQPFNALSILSSFP